jgi:hypothetical protein
MRVKGLRRDSSLRDPAHKKTCAGKSRVALLRRAGSVRNDGGWAAVTWELKLPPPKENGEKQAPRQSRDDTRKATAADENRGKSARDGLRPLDNALVRDDDADELGYEGGRKIERANACANKETSAAAGSVQVIRNGDRPAEEYKGVEIERCAVALSSGIDANPAHQYQTERESPKQLRGLRGIATAKGQKRTPEGKDCG